MNKNFTCPNCEKRLPEETVKEISDSALFDFRSNAGATITSKKTLSSRKNVAAINAKRKAEKEGK